MNTSNINEFSKAPDPQLSDIPESTPSLTTRALLVFFSYIIIMFISISISVYTVVELITSLPENSEIWDAPATEIPETIDYSYEETENFYDMAEETKFLWSQGNYDDMLSLSEELLEIASGDTQSAVAYYWNGLAYYNLGEYETAKDSLTQAVNLDSTYSGPHVTLAAINLNRGEYYEALDHAQTCIDLDPDYAWCYNSLGLSYLSLGKTDEGIDALEKAVSLDPDVYVFQDNLKRARER